MNVTLLISFRVVMPAFTLASADSRRKRMPSSRAARRISDVGRFSRIISRMRSVNFSNSWIAVLPLKPVPAHYMHPYPSWKGTLPQTCGSSPLASSTSAG